jgi:hypothetical protein
MLGLCTNVTILFTICMCANRQQRLLDRILRSISPIVTWNVCRALLWFVIFCRSGPYGVSFVGRSGPNFRHQDHTRTFQSIWLIITIKTLRFVILKSHFIPSISSMLLMISYNLCLITARIYVSPFSYIQY